MSQTATTRWGPLLAAFLVLPLMGAQAQPLDDDFIFFVNGPNVLIPETSFTVVDDPAEGGDRGKVAQFNYGDFTPLSFGGWERTEGTDATAYTGAEYGDSQYKLYVSILSGPENAGKTNSLTFFDSTNDPQASREDLEGGVEGDLEFRAVWAIPDEAHTGEWVDYVIPIPPSTAAALDSAKVGKKSDGSPLDVEFDPIAANWSYTGGWNNGGAFGFGPVGGFNPGPTDPLWQEFAWDKMHSLAVFYDHNTGGESIYLDNVYIAEAPLDLSVAESPPAPMDNISVTAMGEANVVTFVTNPDFGGYNVYASDQPITDLSAPGVLQLSTIPFNAESFEVEHRFEIPHPSLGQTPLYYAVTSTSQFGVENPDVSNSASSVANSNLKQQPYVIQLTDDEANTIFANLANGTVSEEGFPEGYPSFFIDSSHRQLGDSPTPELPEDSDISGRLRMAYSNFNELYIYAEFVDDQVTFRGADGDNPGTETWNFDSFEVGWGNYDVNDIPGGSLLVGSPSIDMQRGEFADYQFRMAGLQDAGGSVVSTTTFIGFSLEAEVAGGGSAVEATDTGWRALTIIPLNAIQNLDQSDVVLDPPGADDIRYIPMEISINDADGETRQHQITWGLKPNHTNQWWNTPAEWPTVAVAGRNTASPVSNEDDAVAGQFELAANYPNPFAQTTEIQYTLPAATDVTVEVFDVLGRRVAVLVDASQPAGQHEVEFDARGLASGLYLYRIQAGENTAVRQMMVVR
ncbi:MAG: T9SS type A sorting domain-containing protein [Bacteroidota bacterium]